MWASGKESACNAGDPGSIPGSGKEMATYSSILAWKNPMDKGAWWAIIHGVARVRCDSDVCPTHWMVSSLRG